MAWGGDNAQKPDCTVSHPSSVLTSCLGSPGWQGESYQFARAPQFLREMNPLSNAQKTPSLNGPHVRDFTRSLCPSLEHGHGCPSQHGVLPSPGVGLRVHRELGRERTPCSPRCRNSSRSNEGRWGTWAIVGSAQEPEGRVYAPGRTDGLLGSSRCAR